MNDLFLVVPHLRPNMSRPCDNALVKLLDALSEVR